jgi:hypothetical protein
MTLAARPVQRVGGEHAFLIQDYVLIGKESNQPSFFYNFIGR